MTTTQDSHTHSLPTYAPDSYIARLGEAVDRLPVAAVVTDPYIADNPIVHVNAAFCEAMDYPREEVLGRNCRFMQGPDTDPRTVREIADAIANEEPVGIDLVNHRRDGTPFLVSLVITPLFEDGKLVAWLGVQSTGRNAD